FVMTPRNESHHDDTITVAIDGNFLALPASGIGTYLRGLLDALNADADSLGVRMHLVEPAPGRFLHPGSKQHRFLWDAFGVAGGVLAAGNPKPDLLHLPQMSAPLSSPIPVVATIHDVIPFVMDDYRASRAMRLYLATMARSVKKARRVIAPSRSAKADIARVLGIPADRIRVIEEAADPSFVPGTGGSAIALVAEKWGLTGRYLFNIGGFDRRKNLPLLIEAFAAALPSLDDDVRLVIAGAPHTGNERVFPPLEPVIREHGVEGRVVLTGRVTDEERLALYQAAHVYITPSEYEGFGLTPLEAMACGVPAIVANRTSLPEVVGDAGLCVEPTVEELLRAIVFLMTDDARHEALSRASLQRASQFSWPRAAKETVEVYREALDK
ncbi:MAG TPA: glycosyltransferase family 1 protein, partial [Thermomicrobiales bacterium]|nr:glycosyltransferase family 1 protein [Thermomicrobiales bacterium]